MDTTLCASTAYQYWRTPPIVKLLATGQEDDYLLKNCLTEAELTAARTEIVERLSFSRACSVARRTQGQDLRVVRESSPLISLFDDGPVELLARTPEQRHTTSVTRYALWKSPLPVGSVKGITYDLEVTSPAFTLVQLASRSPLTRAVMLASELCGGYAVYRAPQPVSSLLQRMVDRGKLPTIEGWRPCLNAGNKLGELWSRPPLTTPNELEDFLAQADFVRGRKTFRDAIGLVKPLAASPFETQAGILLGFSRRRGGEGFGDFTFNEKVELTSDAKLLAQRQCCYCDLFWPDGLDVECQSAAFHDNEPSFLSDSDRIAALSLEGVAVLPLTYAQLNSPSRFAAFSGAVARALKRPQRDKTAAQEAAARKLRGELFVDWWKLPIG
ncbi:hypothetical protein [Paratractidigestivibacter sp.]|uniref:hypothetical protein n=1 Tax=Paratractidigestivibacter sp. TaxID=2847316 RepID=UPI002AC9E15E|nr:hypothetical protein [Paratractidigestivibacter sp.]